MTERELLAEAISMWLAVRRTDYHAISDASNSDGLPDETREIAKKLAANLSANIFAMEKLLTRIDNGDLLG